MATTRIRRLESLDQAQRRHRAIPSRGALVLSREQRKRDRDDAAEQLRECVWQRDGRRCRATGVWLAKAHVDVHKRGEVAHLRARSVEPRLRRSIRNLVLLSAWMHKLSDPRTADAGGKALLEITGLNANKQLIFTLRNLKGHVVWTKASWPPGVGQ